MSLELPDFSGLPSELQTWETQGEHVIVGIGEHRIFVRSLGDQDASPNATLIMLHGYPESSFVYGQSLTAMRERFDRVVVFDFLGFGLSDKPYDHWYSIFDQADITLQVMRALGIRGAHLLAHDMGDSVATELIYRQVSGQLPGWFAGFESVTFTNGNMVMELANLRLGQQLLRTPYIGSLLDKGSAILGPNYRIFANQIRSASGTDLLPEREIELMAAATNFAGGGRIGHKIVRYLDERDRFQTSRWLPAVANVDIPVHVCWGTADAVAPREVAEHLTTVVRPDATLTLLDGVGHFCMQEAPAEWNEAVLDFWQ
ncbi:MAG: alpha/beta hydrolase [Candidatus Nanopelagicales bacterium]